MYAMAKRIAICLALALVTASVAVAKEDMTATLLGKPDFGAAPGTRIKVAWKVSTRVAQSARCFDDKRFYVRLLSKTGARSTHAYGTVCGRRFTARVRIPRGGVGDVEIRLVGMVITPTESHRADGLIPITNDPFP